MDACKISISDPGIQAWGILIFRGEKQEKENNSIFRKVKQGKVRDVVSLGWHIGQWVKCDRNLVKMSVIQVYITANHLWA